MAQKKRRPKQPAPQGVPRQLAEGLAQVEDLTLRRRWLPAQEILEELHEIVIVRWSMPGRLARLTCSRPS